MESRILKTESDKQKLLSRLSDENHRLLFFYDEVPPQNVHCQQVKENVYLVLPPFQYKKLKEWLYLGNWEALVLDSTEFDLASILNTKTLNTEQKMYEANVRLIIKSFFDDIAWVVTERTRQTD